VAETVKGAQARRDAVQPSLWDRLVNDLPGLSSEIEGLVRLVRAELGEARADALIAGGTRAIEADPDLPAEQKQRLSRLVVLERRRGELESRGIVVSADVLREAVRRDIEVLFNTQRFECVPMMSDWEAALSPDDPPALADFPEVRRSVVNYGVPAFSGHTGRDFDREALAREVKGILTAFEPRLKASETRVTVNTGERGGGLSIEIEGLLIMSPAPERLKLRTLIDLDNGRATTRAAGG
jgi:type VI secretion system protein ImpF